MAKEINLDAFADKIAEKLLAAKQQANEAGQDVGEEFVSGVAKGIREHTKEAKSEITKLFEEFNKTTSNFKSRKSISNAEWKNVLAMSKELLNSERYADAVKSKLDGIAVTLKGIGKVSGLTNVLKEIDKAGAKLESVDWDEAGKNYKKKVTTKKTTSDAIDVEKLKQKEVVKTDQVIKEATGSIKKQGDAIEAVTKKALNMEAAVKRYNKLMMDLGVEHLTIGMRLSQDTEGWGLKEMVQEAKNQLADFYNPEHDSYIHADGLTDDIKKRMQSDIGKLKRFIAAYEPYVNSMESTAPAMNSAVKATEKHTDALREQEKAVNDVAKTINQQNQISISSYQDLYKALEKVVELSKQLKPEHTGEFEAMQTIMDKADYPSSKESLIASIKAQYANVQRIKTSTKNGLSVYKDIDGDGYEATRSIDGNTLKDAEDMLRAYIYQAVECFGYTMTDVMDDFDSKRVRTFVEKTISQYLSASSANDEYRAGVEALNAPIKETIDTITSTIVSMVADGQDLDRVLEYLSDLKSEAGAVNRYTLSAQANTIGSKIGIDTPYGEIQANAKKIESYEELCEVVKRYNELQKDSIIFGGTEYPGLNEAEEMERKQLAARLEATGGKDIYKFSGFDGFDNVDKLASALGIAVTKHCRRSGKIKREHKRYSKCAISCGRPKQSIRYIKVIPSWQRSSNKK